MSKITFTDALQWPVYATTNKDYYGLAVGVAAMSWWAGGLPLIQVQDIVLLGQGYFVGAAAFYALETMAYSPPTNGGSY